jgi:surface protein
MKTLSILGAGIALTSLLVSCNNEDMLQGSKTDKLNTLTAYIEEGPAGSRVTIDGEGNFAWETGDNIVYSADTKKFEDWTYASYDATTYLTTFTSEATASDEAYAVFPNSLNPQITDAGLQVTLPASYDINKTAPILTGKCQDGEVGFAHAGGLIRISFENVPSYVTKFELKTNNQNIVGTFTVKDKAITTSKGDNNSVTIAINKDDGADHSTFDVPVPVGTYSGFIINLYYDDEIVYTKSTSEGNTYTIDRRDLIIMPTIALPENYVIETIKGASSETYILGSINQSDRDDIMMDMMQNGPIEDMNNIDTSEYDFDLTQVEAMYIDGKRQDEPTSTYTFTDNDLTPESQGQSEHTVLIIMKDSFTTAKNMFRNCSYATSIDLSHLDTSNVTNMSKMFYACSNLASIDLSHLNTASVSDISYMFYGCSNLASIDLSHLNTSSISDISYMFAKCEGLSTIDLSVLDCKSLTDINHLFWACKNLKSVNLSGFDTSNITNMSNLFDGCENLEDADVSKFDTSKNTNMAFMFYNCKKLTSIDVSKFDTSKATSMDAMFRESGITSIDVSNFDTSNVTDMTGMFRETNLTSIDISNFDTSKVTSIEYIFYCCYSLKSVKMGGKLSSITKSDSPFDGITTEGEFYYPTSDKSYSEFATLIPTTWKAYDISTVDSNLSKKSSTAE